MLFHWRFWWAKHTKGSIVVLFLTVFWVLIPSKTGNPSVPPSYESSYEKWCFPKLSLWASQSMEKVTLTPSDSSTRRKTCKSLSETVEGIPGNFQTLVQALVT